MRMALVKTSVLAAAVSLSACSILPAQTAPRLMGLTPSSLSTEFATARDVSLRIDTPLATAPFDSARILIKPTAYEFQALPEARWRDSMPVLLREYLVEGFRQSGGFDNVLTDTSPATAELSLIGELSGFHAAKEDGKTTVIIQLYTELMNNRTRERLCVRDQRVRMPADSTSLTDLMHAFSAGAEALSKQTIVWAYNCQGPD